MLNHLPHKLLLAALAALLLATAEAFPEVADSQIRWALPTVSVACMREEPRHGAEMCSQVVMGTPLRVDSIAGEWLRILTPEGYAGWIIDNSLKTLTDRQFTDWRTTPRVVVRSVDQTWVYDNDSILAPDRRVSDVVNGAILFGSPSSGPVSEVMLPDGRRGFIPSDAVVSIAQWASAQLSTERLLALGRAMMGQPYLWGGTSTKGNDCSGLTKILYYDQGFILPRDANQQALVGQPIDPKHPEHFRQGDLLFFASPTSGRIVHVAIYDSDGVFLHSSGRVKLNSLRPESPLYYGTQPAAAVRIAGSEQQMKSSLHPWYFIQ